MSDDCDQPAPPNKKQKLDGDEGTSSMEVDDGKKEDFSVDPKYSDFVTPEEVEKLKEFKVLDEVKGDESGDEGSVSSDGSLEVPDDEIERMLDEDLPDNFKGAPKPKEKPYVTSQKIVLEEKGVNHFEVLPLDWIMVRHYSGMPVYLHRNSRVCTLAKPYFIGTGNAKRHDIPISAIPCLNYRRALEEEEKQKEIDRKRAEYIKNGTWDHLIAQAQNCPNKNNMQGIAKNSIRNVIASETMKFYDPKEPKTKEQTIENTPNKSKNNHKNCKNSAPNKDYVKNNEIDNDFDKNIRNEVNTHDTNTSNDLEYVDEVSTEFNFKRPFPKKVSKQSYYKKSYNPQDTLNDDNTQLLINDLTCIDITNVADGPYDVNSESKIDKMLDGDNSENTKITVSTIADDSQNTDIIDDLENTNSISTGDTSAYNNKDLISESKIDNMTDVDNSDNAKIIVITKHDDSQNTDIKDDSEKMYSSTDDSNKPYSNNDHSKGEEFTVITKDGDSHNTDIKSDNAEKIDLNTDNSTNNEPIMVDNLQNTDKSKNGASNSDNLQNTDNSTNTDSNAGNSKTVDSTKDPTSELDIPLAAQPVILPGGIVMSPPRVENVNSSWKTQHLSHEQVNEYCKKLFKFKTINMMHFMRWADKRKYAKARKTLQYPTLPQGTKLITIPAANQQGGDGPHGAAGGSGKSSKRDWVMNMNGRSYLSVFHEYVHRALQKQPVYEFQQLENASAPYQATVYIGGMQYGCGRGSSKRAAKANAARASIHILIPEMRLENDVEEKTEDDHFSFFDHVTIEDPRITEFCLSTCEPSPHAILRTCLLRNFGAGERHIQTEMKKLEYQDIELTMKVGKHSATVVCKNKKTAKQRASQAILQALHPHVKSWGSLLRLYGSRSVKSCKEKKLEEQEITLLQDKAKHNSPNFAVLEKLRQEMQRLKERHEAVVPIGTLLLTDDLPKGSSSSLNNVDL